MEVDRIRTSLYLFICIINLIIISYQRGLFGFYEKFFLYFHSWCSTYSSLIGVLFDVISIFFYLLLVLDYYGGDDLYLAFFFSFSFFLTQNVFLYPREVD